MPIIVPAANRRAEGIEALLLACEWKHRIETAGGARAFIEISSESEITSAAENEKQNVVIKRGNHLYRKCIILRRRISQRCRYLYRAAIP